MIKLKKVDTHYYRCLSCNKSVDELDVYNVVSGINSSHTTTFRFCTDCLNDLKMMINRLPSI